uniref:TIL domain-containing protein n=1 Tax=Panagrellus redivivus TaxID=6233 RepID=A0A7E4UNF3_PANRE
MVALNWQECLIFGITLAVTFIETTSQDDSCTATWHVWSEWSTCTDSCGGCGIYMRTRVCLTTSTACNCEGMGTELDYCNFDVCRYPRPACCYNRAIWSTNGRFACKLNQTTSFITDPS